ncbi:hypothetical protein TKK_0010668 [Trichogramma kaykai]|uniref:Peptidase S1 domain-containing protein n=1 Tax=Trichogramma kaykai TaxID=54128 RepID=A0ABD2WVV7_9HYME
MDQWHIITAAHCVTDNVTHEILDLPWTVVAGTVDLKNRGVAVYHDVHMVFIPKSFMANSPGDLNHDIAVLRLRRLLPLGIHPYLGSIQLPRADQYLPPENQTAVMSGFGTYNQARQLNGDVTSGPLSQFLRYAQGIINVPDAWGCEDFEVCVESMGKRQGYLQGTCYGDSGGPLYDEKTNILIGVISYFNYAACGDIARFTRVSAHLPFIADVIFNNFDVSVLWWRELLHNMEGMFPLLAVCDI